MANTLALAANLYTKPPKTAIPGAKREYRQIALLTTDLVTTQLYAIAVLPANHRLGDFFIESDDLDTHTTPTITVDVGILNTYYPKEPAASSTDAADYNNATGRTEEGDADTQTNTATQPELVTGHNLVTASTICQGGGRLTGPYPTTLTPSSDIGVDSKKDRIIAIQFSTVPATAAAGNFAIGFSMDQD